MNTSATSFVSPATMFVAAVLNTTYLPLPLITASQVSRSAGAPVADTLTRRVVPATRSRRNTSNLPTDAPPPPRRGWRR